MKKVAIVDGFSFGKVIQREDYPLIHCSYNVCLINNCHGVFTANNFITELKKFLSFDEAVFMLIKVEVLMY